VLVSLRPDWDRRTARAAAHAMFGLLNSTPHSARLSQAAMAGLLEELAVSALSAGQPHAEPSVAEASPAG
jgi:hypothetical protein